MLAYELLLIFQSDAYNYLTFSLEQMVNLMGGYSEYEKHSVGRSWEETLINLKVIYGT